MSHTPEWHHEAGNAHNVWNCDKCQARRDAASRERKEGNAMTEWGYRSYGRGESDTWCDDLIDAKLEMTRVEDKYKPVVLISRETSPVHVYPQHRIDMEW